MEIDPIRPWNNLFGLIVRLSLVVLKLLKIEVMFVKLLL